MAVSLLVAISVLAYSQTTITVRGSDAMILFGQKCSNFYGVSHPTVKVNVGGGGGEKGLNALAGRTAEIVQLTDGVGSAVRQKLEAKVGGRVVQIPVGVEGVIVFVNSANPVNELTLAQLRDIYTGKVSNWKQVGGRDERIQLYSTEDAVGGSLFFGEIVLNGEDFDTTMRGFSHAQETWRAVAGDTKGIGFGAVQEQPGAKRVRIAKARGTPAVEASLDNVRNGSFPLSRHLYWVLSAGNSGAVRDFAMWAVSPQGQLVVESVGYYPLNPADRKLATTTLTSPEKGD